jgi:hypothetical protein
MKKKRVCDIAVEVLKESNNPAVMWGDAGLLDTIAARAGIARDECPIYNWRRVLNALSRQPGILKPKLTMAGNRAVRIFRLPEEE